MANNGKLKEVYFDTYRKREVKEDDEYKFKVIYEVRLEKDLKRIYKQVQLI